MIVACLASFKVLLSTRKGTSYPGASGAGDGAYGGNANSGRKEAGNRRSRYGSRYASNKGSATRVGHRELTSGSYENAEMQNMSKKHGHANITITGGRDRDSRSRRLGYGEKDWDDDAESQQHIMHGDDIRVQTTWNVEPETQSPLPHPRQRSDT